MYDLHRKRFPCNQCGGSKSLAKYDDGKFCFKCGYDTRRLNRGTTNTEIKYTYRVEERNYSLWDLDDEYTRYLREVGLQDTVYKMYKTNEYGGRLFIPIYNEDNELIFCQFKNIHHKDTDTIPKCISKGEKPFIFFTQFGFKEDISKRKGPVVIVEDPFSAMKVSQVATAFCLFGNSLKRTLLKQLIKIDKEVVIWLDSDEGGYTGAARISEMLRPYLNYRVLFTKKDPKYYSDLQIRGYLNE